MAIPMGKEVAREIPPFVRVFKDGSVERLMPFPNVTPLFKDPETRVSSKDINLSQNPSILARLLPPKTQ